MPKETNIKAKTISEPKISEPKVNLKGSWVDAEEKEEKEHALPYIYHGQEGELPEMEDLGEDYAKDDDEVQETTDPDVVKELGFDPLEFVNGPPE